MPLIKPHIIRTKCMEVTFENPKNALECKDQLASVCKSRLLPAMEKLFDQKCGKKKIISIDKVLINAGLLDQEDWENKLVETVINQLNQYLETGVLGKSDDSNSGVEGEGVKIYKGGNESEALLHFLKHGVLPWYTNIKSKEVLQSQLMQLLTVPGVRPLLAKLFQENPAIFMRLAYHAQPRDVMEFFEGKSTRTELEQCNRIWQGIFSRTGISTLKQKEYFFRAVYRVLVKDGPEEGLKERIATKLVQQLSNEEYIKLKELVENSRKDQFLEDEIEMIHWLERAFRGSRKNIGLQEDGIHELTRESGKKIRRSERNEDPLFIANSGLVLLHPFLESLFKNTGYTEEKNWISKEGQQRSILLSQYLVTGVDEYAEFDLTLNKILMGYAEEEPLPVEIQLSPFEKEEAADLLKSVIKHWKALKNTGIQALQSTFLQREGKLVRNDSGCLLRVEQKPFDILLDKIPWGFSTIKTPWMEEILSVEWM